MYQFIILNTKSNIIRAVIYDKILKQKNLLKRNLSKREHRSVYPSLFRTSFTT